MISVWYDGDCDQIWITDESRSYARRSLVAWQTGNTITITLKAASAGDFVISADFSQIADVAGNGFATPDAAKAYLDGEFAKRRAVGETYGTPVVAGENLVPGMPVSVSRATGLLLPARADTYTLSFVTGLVSDVIGQGFATTPIRGAVTMADWTEQTGEASLHVGVPYFLAPEGGLTISPFGGAGLASVRVGTALSANTLSVAPTDPILF